MSLKKPHDFEPALTFPKGHRLAGHPRCLAWSRSAGRQCGNPAKIMTGGGVRPHPADRFGHMSVCRAHGADSPKGQASPAWQTGEHSQYELPPHLQARVDQLLDDDLTDQYERLAMLTGLEQHYTAELTGDDDRDAKQWAKIFEVQKQLKIITELQMRREYADGIPRSVVMRGLRRVMESWRIALMQSEGISQEGKARLWRDLARVYFAMIGSRLPPELDPREELPRPDEGEGGA